MGYLSTGLIIAILSLFFDKKVNTKTTSQMIQRSLIIMIAWPLYLIYLIAGGDGDEEKSN